MKRLKNILKIKDSSFIYTPEGTYFSELTLYNDEDFFNSDIIHKNKSVSRMLDTYAPIFGNAVLVKVANDFSCGSIDEIVEMTAEEIARFM